MLGFPPSTEFNKRIPKQKFYENAAVPAAVKRLFADQLRCIYWRNKLAVSTLNLTVGERVTEIEIFELCLTGPKLDEAVLRQIDSEIPYHILFVLSYENKVQAWIGCKDMKDVYYSADEYSQTNLEDLESNIKEDRTDLDLLFGCLLDWGLPLSMPYRSEKIDNCTVHTYAPGDAALNVPDALIACFDSNVPENVIKEIAKRKPRRAVFRDSSFASSPEKINVFEIFKLYAPDTDVKVI